MARIQSTARPKTEAEQLKERLLQLELTVTELKEQLNALEEAKKNATPVIMEAKYTPGATASANPAPVKPKQDDDKKGESTLQIYGAAMLDSGYQFGSNHPDWFDVVRPTKLPSFEDEFAPDGKTFFGVRQSRFGVKSSKGRFLHIDIPFAKGADWAFSSSVEFAF